jgi:hypothetical protein
MHVLLDASRKVVARATSISRCYRVGIALNLLQYNTVGRKRPNADPCVLRDTSASRQLGLVFTDCLFRTTGAPGMHAAALKSPRTLKMPSCFFTLAL